MALSSRSRTGNFRLFYANAAAPAGLSASYQTLRRFWALGKREKDCNTTGDRVPIEDLLRGISERPPAGDRAFEMSGGPIYHGPVMQVFPGGQVQQLQATTTGDVQMGTPGAAKPPRSPWASGSFYLVVVLLVLVALAVIENHVSAWALPIVLITGILFTVIIGALQLRQDEKLSQKNFLELMRLSFRQIPLIGQLAGLIPSKDAAAKDVPTPPDKPAH